MASYTLSCSFKEQEIVQNHKQLFEEKHENVSYTNVVCKKPWGHEFLVYSSKRIGIWCLTVHSGHTTSLHTHFHKDTFLIVLEGCAKISRLSDEPLILHTMESVHIPKHVFHGIASFSPSTTILEIEIFDSEHIDFSDKNDVLRLDDMYGRKATGYEQSIQRFEDEENLRMYEHYQYNNEPLFVKYKGVTLQFSNILSSKANYNILLHKSFYDTNRGLYIQEGSVLDSSMTSPFDSLILSIEKPYCHEEKKRVYSSEQRDILVKQLRLQKKSIILTSGCYDIVHIGHLSHLQKAKQLGDILMVCLSSDQQITALKGSGRPINHYEDRITFFQTIPYVDYIILYNEEQLESEGVLGSIMKAISPDIWVKGSDYTKEAIFAKHPYLQKIVLFENVPNHSTSLLVEKIKS
jgi:rfaE bifunctional protein nucleotidyltransferase chain/domain